MRTRPKPKRRFAICIRTDDSDLLTPRRIYEVLPDESAAKSQHIRVVDNEGEDYLYPTTYFLFVDFGERVRLAKFAFIVVVTAHVSPWACTRSGPALWQASSERSGVVPGLAITHCRNARPDPMHSRLSPPNAGHFIVRPTPLIAMVLVEG